MVVAGAACLLSSLDSRRGTGSFVKDCFRPSAGWAESAEAGEGLAEAGGMVVVIGLNSFRSTLGEVSGVDSGVGLADFVTVLVMLMTRGLIVSPVWVFRFPSGVNTLSVFTLMNEPSGLITEMVLDSSTLMGAGELDVGGVTEVGA